MNTIMLCGNAVPLDKERDYFLDCFISNVCRCVEGLLPKAELMELYEIDDASWAKHIAGNKLLHRMVTAEAARRIANGVADYERARRRSSALDGQIASGFTFGDEWAPELAELLSRKFQETWEEQAAAHKAGGKVTDRF